MVRWSNPEGRLHVLPTITTLAASAGAGGPHRHVRWLSQSSEPAQGADRVGQHGGRVGSREHGHGEALGRWTLYHAEGLRFQGPHTHPGSDLQATPGPRRADAGPRAESAALRLVGP